MRLGAISTTLNQFEFEDGLRSLQDNGIQAIELAIAGYHNVAFGEQGKLLADKLLANREERVRFTHLLGRHDLTISAFAIHGQPLTPDREAKQEYSRQFRQACKLAEALGVERLTLLAGLPEGAAGDTCPTWITCPFPYSLMDAYQWQWTERVIPYWREHAGIAEAHGCRLCFEMHPGDVVFNPETLMRLRAEIGPVVGCNFDPSHLFWQGIDPLEALRFLGDAVYHVHAKDVEVLRHNTRVNGVLDPKPFGQVAIRSWIWRTPGWGHGEEFWRAFTSTLRLIGYDDVISLETEGDEFMDSREGLARAATFLRPLMFEQRPEGQWWHATYRHSDKVN